MTTTVDLLLDSFLSLPDDQKHRVASEILRWAVRTDQPPLEGDDLVAVAEEIFLGLEADEREQG